MPSRRIVALLYDLASLAEEGGRQRQNRLLCKSVSDYAATHGVTFDVVSLLDPPGWYHEQYLNGPITGCGGQRLRFVIEASKAMAKPHDVLIVGVVDFWPLLLVRPFLRSRGSIITIVHGIEVWKRLPYWRRIAMQRATRVLSVSEYTAQRVVELQGIDPRVVVVIHNPLAPAFLTGMSTTPGGQGSARSRLLTISRMNRIDSDKGIDTVISTLPEVRKAVPDVTYVVIGDGDDRPRLETLSQRLGVDDIVRFVGRVSDSEVHEYLAGTDVFVMPSRKEGFGLVFLEAMAYRKPVIAAARGGSVEVIADGKTGVLVPFGDAHVLGREIIQLLQDPESRRRMGAAGRARVDDRFSYARFDASVKHLLDEVLPGA